MANEKDPVDKAQLMDELAAKLADMALTIEPRLSLVDISSAYMAAAIGLNRSTGITNKQIAKALRKLADGIQSGAFDDIGKPH